jgi:hypothetical protein
MQYLDMNYIGKKWEDFSGGRDAAPWVLIAPLVAIARTSMHSIYAFNEKLVDNLRQRG